MNHKRIARSIFTTGSGLIILAILATLAVASSQIDIPGPTGSEAFGREITILPNGNLVVCDPGYDAGNTLDVGAAYLYDGASGALISTLTGSTQGDRVCDDGVTVLSSGNFVVTSRLWDNGKASNAGAVTWGSGTIGVNGSVSSANSLVGSTVDDMVGFGGVIELTNGNYVVRSPYWDNDGVVDAGAVTWGRGATGIAGPISPANSLVGSTMSDGIGSVKALSDGNYVVVSSSWDNGGVVDAGAVTWADGNAGIIGVVSAANSLVGVSTSDQIGDFGVTELTGGKYAVRSPNWDNGLVADAGAVTWSLGAIGIAGPVTPANSLVGSSAGDKVGTGMVQLANGNCLASSAYWDNGEVVDAGAVTWVNCETGLTGPVTPANSLVGSTAYDMVGNGGGAELANGNYLVFSPYWDNGAVVDAGAVTWVSGTTGISGAVSAANSLVGDNTYANIGYFGVTELANGNYVVPSPGWDNGVEDTAGAATWANGTTGITGTISAANSLVGTKAGDRVSSGGVIALTNGNYVVLSDDWDNSGVTNAGAVTWGNGATGIRGPVSAANSLVGSTAFDKVGYPNSVVALSNGNYVVGSSIWDNGTIIDTGAVTWGDGMTGISGPINSANSLVGTTPHDQAGGAGVYALANGNYVVHSITWDNGTAVDAGAVTWADGTIGITGPISTANSLVGETTGDSIGSAGVYRLANGNYVITSPDWDNGAIVDAGAVTWGNGATGITGLVNATNSLVGSAANDQIGGLYGIIKLDNGNYVVTSPNWDNGSVVDAGAVTWGDGAAGIAGPVSAANSLVGSTNEDKIGSGSVDPLANGDYLVVNPLWDNGAITDAGAVTWGSGVAGVQGTIVEENSVRGTVADGGKIFRIFYDPTNDQLIVGWPAGNTISLFQPNRAPVAEAGWPKSVARGALVRLDGSASYDPDGNLPLQFTWTQTGGPPVNLSDSHSVSPTFTAPDERAVLTFNLVVTDALGSNSLPSKSIVFVDPYRYFWPLMPEH